MFWQVLTSTCASRHSCVHFLDACTFSTSQLPTVVRTCGPLTMFASKCASRHSRVHFSKSYFPKAVRIWGVFKLSWKRALHHSRVHFFNTSTSQSGPNVRPFDHVRFEMCFAPQPHAFFDMFLTFVLEMGFAPQPRPRFQHLNFQKWSENGVLLPFWLWNTLCATAAYTFSTSKLPKVVRTWNLFSMLLSKFASRHSVVQVYAIFERSSD